jgi:hypothetical protein
MVFPGLISFSLIFVHVYCTYTIPTLVRGVNKTCVRVHCKDMYNIKYVLTNIYIYIYIYIPQATIGSKVYLLGGWTEGINLF